jgi:hypothetical protein
MSRIKFVVIVIALCVVTLGVLPASAAAPNPQTCLPSCWGSNFGSANGLGTQDKSQLWLYYANNQGLYPTAKDLQDLVRNAVINNLPSATLTLYNCSAAQATTCPARQYTFTFDGETTFIDFATLPIPTSGVPIPAPYVLGGALVIAVLLIAIGFGLRHRAQRKFA